MTILRERAKKAFDRLVELVEGRTSRDEGDLVVDFSRAGRALQVRVDQTGEASVWLPLDTPPPEEVENLYLNLSLDPPASSPHRITTPLVPCVLLECLPEQLPGVRSFLSRVPDASGTRLLEFLTNGPSRTFAIQRRRILLSGLEIEPRGAVDDVPALADLLLVVDRVMHQLSTAPSADYRSARDHATGPVGSDGLWPDGEGPAWTRFRPSRSPERFRPKTPNYMLVPRIIAFAVAIVFGGATLGFGSCAYEQLRAPPAVEIAGKVTAIEIREPGRAKDNLGPFFRFSYTVGEQSHTGGRCTTLHNYDREAAQAEANRHRVGEPIQLWYPPDSPELASCIPPSSRAASGFAAFAWVIGALSMAVAGVHVFRQLWFSDG